MCSYGDETNELLAKAIKVEGLLGQVRRDLKRTEPKGSGGWGG
jgi:hypothetical protein